MLKFTVTDEEQDGEFCERLDIEAADGIGTTIKIVLWEDAVSWIYFRKRRPKQSRAAVFKMHADLHGLNAEAAAELIRATLRDQESVKVGWREHALVRE